MVRSSLIALALAAGLPAGAAESPQERRPLIGLPNCVMVSDALICAPPGSPPPAIYCEPTTEAKTALSGETAPAGSYFCGVMFPARGESA